MNLSQVDLPPSSQPGLPVPASGFPVYENMALRIRAYSLAVVAIPFQIEWTERLYDLRRGYYYQQTSKVVQIATGMANEFFIPLTRGELVSFSVYAVGAGTFLQYGDLYFEVEAGGWNVNNAIFVRYATLCADWYGSTLGPFAWNSAGAATINRQPRWGLGSVQTVAITTPAAGADFTFTFNPNSYALIRSVTGIFGASVAAGNRLIRWNLTNLGVIPAFAIASKNLIALDVLNFELGNVQPVTTTIGSNNFMTIPFPSVPLVPDPVAPTTLTSSTTGILAADQYSALAICYERFVYPNTFIP
jgi:hypothetical protein